MIFQFAENRLRHFDILVYNPSTTSWDEYNTGRAELCHHQYNQSPTPLSVTCKQGRMKGKFVKILMKKKQNVFSKQTLTLCEVEVWGRIRTENFTSGKSRVTKSVYSLFVINDQFKSLECLLVYILINVEYTTLFLICVSRHFGF